MPCAARPAKRLGQTCSVLVCWLRPQLTSLSWFPQRRGLLKGASKCGDLAMARSGFLAGRPLGPFAPRQH
eukprot:54057-Pyramimonas_sp.AAC.1